MLRWSALQASGGCPWISGRADQMCRSWNAAGNRDSTVGAFFQNGNRRSAQPPRALAFWFVEGLSTKAPNGTITEWHGGRTSAARDPAEPWVAAGAEQMLLWSCRALPLALGAFRLFSRYSGERVLLALLRGLWIAWAWAWHSQSLRGFLGAGSSLYLAGSKTLTLG